MNQYLRNRVTQNLQVAYLTGYTTETGHGNGSEASVVQAHSILAPPPPPAPQMAAVGILEDLDTSMRLFSAIGIFSAGRVGDRTRSAHARGASGAVQLVHRTGKPQHWQADHCKISQAPSTNSKKWSELVPVESTKLAEETNALDLELYEFYKAKLSAFKAREAGLGAEPRATEATGGRWRTRSRRARSRRLR